MSTCKRLVVRLDSEGSAKHLVVEFLTAVHDGKEFDFDVGVTIAIHIPPPPQEVFLNKFLWPMCWSYGI